MKWIDIEVEKPRPADEILFTDGSEVFYGWLESYNFGEDPIFYALTSGPYDYAWPEDITHWMELPKPPR